MPTVLITAFEPYDRWSANSSWLALVELTREVPAEPKVITRRYPVDFAEAKERLYNDLNANYDYALFLGQSPGSARVHLESIAVNVAGSSQQLPDEFVPLIQDGPIAYQSPLPLARWAQTMREVGIPAQVSYHAGTFLCNAVSYLAQHYIEARGLKTQTAFIHLPLAPSQTTNERQDWASLPTAVAAAAIRLILDGMADNHEEWA